MRARERAAVERGQVAVLLLGSALVLLLALTFFGALGMALLGKGRVQRGADLAAVSAARSMRDDFPRLFERASAGGQRAAARHLEKREYMARATRAAVSAARRNGVTLAPSGVRFPDGRSFAPVRVRVVIRAGVDVQAHPGEPDARRVDVEATAEAELVPPAPSPRVPATAGPGAGGRASGGGYSGPLAYRQGKPMRPDVALAFDRLEAAARKSGLALIVVSGYRSDEEQARLFAQNPDPRWVAPPGKSLHRYGTELDLGPSAAYGWLARNARRFAFIRRYAWEPWHYGYVGGGAIGAATRAEDGGAAGSDRSPLPSFVPPRYAEPIARAADRWNVPAELLAAQLYVESNFNPFARSPAGALGIAQFMPGTAAAYGLRDPFDPDAAIDAQAHLMRDLLRRFGGSIPLALAGYNAGPGAVERYNGIPPYPETRAYVARILGLMRGAGALPTSPGLEVRLVS